MYFGRAGIAQQLHDWAAGVAAHNAVIDQNYALALQIGSEWVVFQLHTGLAQIVIRLNKGAPDVAVLDQAFGKWNPTVQAVANRVRRGAVRHSNHGIGIDWRFLGQFAPQPLAYLVHHLAFHHAIGAGKINILKAAQRMRHAGVAFN